MTVAVQRTLCSCDQERRNRLRYQPYAPIEAEACAAAFTRSVAQVTKAARAAGSLNRRPGMRKPCVASYQRATIGSASWTAEIASQVILVSIEPFFTIMPASPKAHSNWTRELWAALNRSRCRTREAQMTATI